LWRQETSLGNNKDRALINVSRMEMVHDQTYGRYVWRGKVSTNMERIRHGTVPMMFSP